MYPYRHQYQVIPGLVTIRSNYKWTLTKLLIVALIVVVGLVVLKRFSGPPSRQSPFNNVFHRSWSYYQPRASKSFANASPLRYREPDRYKDPPLRQPRQHQSATPSFVPTRQRRKKLTKRQKQSVLRQYKHRCAMCQKNLQPFDTEMDHIIALAEDPYGLRNDLNHISNFRPLCRRCHGFTSFQQRKAGLFSHRRDRRKPVVYRSS